MATTVQASTLAVVLATAGLAACASIGPSPALEHGAVPHGEWGYEGPTGPDHWAELSADYAVCSTGSQESPIDLQGEIIARLGALEFDWRPMPLVVQDTGHSIQATAAAGSALTMGGKHYQLLQFHIHHPSEHLVGGRRFPLEIHFVHQAADGGLAVLGVLVDEGAASPGLAAVLAGLDDPAAAAGIDPGALLPQRRDFFRYEGSLTTPPCTENVAWAVLADPVQADAAQIEAFAVRHPMNARPIQPLHRRFLLRSE